MKKITNIEVELRKGNDDKISFHLKQYDDVVLNIKVYDGLTPISLEGETVYLAIDKPDGTKILQKEDIVVDGYNIEVMLSTQAVVAPGVCKLELILESDNGLLTTAITNYMVTEALSTSIVDIITSSNDIHHLKLIEDFILNSNFAIEDINYSLNAIKERIRELEEEIETIGAEIIENVENTEDKAIENIEIVKDNALGEIDTAKNEILSKANEVIIEVETAKGEVNELMATIEASKEEVDEMGQAQVANIIGTGRSAVIEINEAKEDALDNIEVRTNLIVEEAGTEISRVKDDAINEITAKKDEIVALASEEMSNKKDEIVSLASDNLEEIKTNTINEMNETKESTISDINTVKEDITNDLSEAVSIIEETKESAINTITNTKNEAVEVIGNTKDTTIEEMTQAKDALIEELSRVETGTVEGVDEAVKLAQKRLQEETVKSIWEVQECTANQRDTIEAVSRQEQRNISDKTLEEIGKINNAGANIVEMVEGLDANIEQGLKDISNSIEEGKTEIRDLSTSEINKIRETGAEITEAVANLEINTTDNIDRINRAGEGARNTIESKSLVEQGEINRVASEQKASIREAGNDKLEEINAILGVSKGEVEELLSTTRNEINTHRSDFAKKVADSKEEIDNLKTNSMTELTTHKDDLVNEILGAEIALKEDFTALRDEYIAEIDAKGTSRVDALQRMIDAIDALEIAVDRKLEISEERSETLENTLINVDNKIVEIRPVLDNLNEMRNICLSLQAENIEANANIEELDFLHIEADTRIVELRRLIEEARQYEDIVQAYIDARGGNHEEIEARLDALEEAMTNIMTREEVEGAITREVDIINDVLSNKVAFEDLNDYAPGKLAGRFGESIYIHSSEAFKPEAEETLDFTPTHILQMTYFSSSNTQYVTFYFKVDLDNTLDKYISLDGNVLKLNGMTRNEDYVAIMGKGTGTTGVQSYTLNATFRFTQLDFNIYNTDRSAIVVANPKKAGLDSFNKAKETGMYTIDLPLNSYKTMEGSVKINTQSNIKGILEVVNIGSHILQRKTLYSTGQVYIRILGEEWRRIDGDKNSDSKMRIGTTESEAIPKVVQIAPSNPYFWNTNTGYIIFRTAENGYRAIYTYDAPLKCFYSGSTSIFISHENNRVAHFTSSDGMTWKPTDRIASVSNIGNISVTKAYFKVYACSHPVYTSNSYTDIYQDVTEIDLSGEEVLNNFREIAESGLYEVDIKAGDDISYAPYGNTEIMYAVDDEEFMSLYDEDNDGFISEEVFKSAPALIDVNGNNIYKFSRGIIDRAITGKLNVSIIKDKRYLTYTDISGEVLQMTYDGSEWTEWIPVGGGADMSEYSTTEEVRNLINETIGVVASALIEDINSIIGGI